MMVQFNTMQQREPKPSVEDFVWSVESLTKLINLQCIKTNGNGVWIGAGSGYQGSPTRLIRSTDNGKTWNLSSTINRAWSSIDIGENNFCVLVSGGGSVGVNTTLTSSNNGLTWVQNNNILGSYYSIVTDKKGNWIGVGGNRILTSNDNGTSWYEYELNETINLYSIATDGKGTWMASSVTGDYRIIISKDNGSTWSYIQVPENNSWRSIESDKNGLWIGVADYGTNRILIGKQTL